MSIRTVHRLVTRRIHALWMWWGHTASLSSIVLSQVIQTLLDMRILWIKIRCTLVGINRILDLIVASLVKSTKVVPDLTDIGVDTDRLAISIQRIPELVDLEVKQTDRAPECGIPAVPVHSLLIGLVGLAKVLLGHVATAHQVPGLRVRVVAFDGTRQEGDGEILVHERSLLLVIEPSELLQDLGVIRVLGQNVLIGVLCAGVLKMKNNCSRSGGS